jgi:pyruvate kinase
MRRSAYPQKPRCTKIVATVGPGTATREGIAGLLEAGVDCIRINGSHGNHTDQAQIVTWVREESARLERVTAILYDLQGPKIRVGKFEGPPRAVKANDEITFAVRRAPTAGELPADYDLLDRDVKVGDPLLIDDGAISTQVTFVADGTVKARVLNEGTIEQRKGINLPATAVSAPAVTAKDEFDALFAAGQGVDVIALSFVRRGDDVSGLKAFLKSHGHHVPLIAKIEKPQALENLTDILEQSWGVMVARGDLGVELPPEKVPMAQKHIISEARRLGRPVITATQMLDSMTRNPRPTRAEASDVANAVIDGTDAVMLSQETAVGRYPFDSVRMMARIISHTEKERELEPQGRRREREMATTSQAVTDAAVAVAHHLKVRAIVAFTRSGNSVLSTAQRRPDAPIYGMTPDANVLRLLSLVWGVLPVHMPLTENTDHLIAQLDRELLARALAAPGDRLVLLMGAPTRAMAATNTMMIRNCGDPFDSEG